MEKETKKITSLEALVFFYRHHALTEFLQTLTNKELKEAKSSIVAGDIEGERIGILDAIIQEEEYRLDATIRNINLEIANKAK